jgi:hypothetical protein
MCYCALRERDRCDTSMNRVTIPEAAQLLGLTQSAVRQRIRRGNIEYEKDEKGRTYVFLDSDETRTDDARDQSRDMLLFRSMQDQIDTLKGELALRNEELRRKDHLLAALTEKLPPALEPPVDMPQEASESFVSGQKEASMGSVSPEREEPAQRRSWWRRILQ